tara:strand:- start:191 stop:826 length:636 start_codon:yes stop_codon:yes gene_type:complete
LINKDTKLYGSFSSKAGNKGCLLFNNWFRLYDLNAIYKSFSIDSVEKIVNSARWLNFSGFAVSMPFKKQILSHVDSVSPEVEAIGAANTIINSDGELTAYNTDYLAAKKLISGHSHLTILGDGGYAAAVEYAAKSGGLSTEKITRKNWSDIDNLREKLVFNCTPVQELSIHPSNEYIDCCVHTKTGQVLGMIQASHQFELYTGLESPLEIT